MIKVICDVCGKQPALELMRVPIVMESGRRLLVSGKIEIDDGDGVTNKIDICTECVKAAIRAFMKLV